jgi:PAS domain S-box-containing protein
MGFLYPSKLLLVPMVTEFIFGFALVLTAVLFLVVAFLTFLKSSLPFKKPFLALALVVAFLAVTFLMEIITPDLGTKLLWNDLEYISNVSLAPLYFLFIMAYTGNERWNNKKRALLLFLLPTFILVSLYTNDWHHLFYTSVNGSDGFGSFNPSHGPLFFLAVIYMMAIYFYALFHLFMIYLKSGLMFRKQVRYIILSSILPLLILAIGYIGFAEVTLTMVTISSFLVGGMMMFFGLFRYELNDLMPIAMDTVMGTMNEGAIVLNNKGLIVHINPSAEKMVGKSLNEVFKKSVGEEIDWLHPIHFPDAMSKSHSELSVKKDGGTRNYDLQVSTMNDRGGRPTGQLLIIRDITAEKMMKDALTTANAKLNILSNITRHDIQNQLVVVRGYAELLSRARSKPDEIERYSKAIIDASALIDEQFAFAREYQAVGVKQPEWQRVDILLTKVRNTGPFSPVNLVIKTGKLEIYADLMLERMFYNLMDNAKRHGQRVNSIVVETRVIGKECLIIFQDSGEGVKKEFKERIFESGFGSNTGMGLYMCREILKMTGITIIETGEEGKGARFEMVVPEGSWRSPEMDKVVNLTIGANSS